MAHPPRSDRKIPPIKDTMAKPLPKRFYADAKAGLVDGVYRILLDGRAAKTPRKAGLAVAHEGLAVAMAAEWGAQVEVINPAKMPLTTLVCTALDAVAGQEAEVAAEIANYAGSDLICYRAEGPQALVALEADAWDPLVTWAQRELGAQLKVTSGLVHVTQPETVKTAVAAALRGLPTLQLAATHVLTTLMGSAVLALAVQRKRLTLEQAWRAAHVDEDWQIKQWGEDDEARARRVRRKSDADAAGFILSCV